MVDHQLASPVIELIELMEVILCSLISHWIRTVHPVPALPAPEASNTLLSESTEGPAL